MARTEPSEFRTAINPEDDRFDVEEWPFYQVSQLVGLYYLRLDSVLKPLGIDASRWRVLMTLATGKANTVTRIAEEAVTKTSTMAKTIQRMAAEGLVETGTSSKDARLVEVVLTPAGRALLAKIRHKVGKLSREAFETITDDELQALNTVSRKLHRNLLP